jgi:hypothetical protein
LSLAPCKGATARKRNQSALIAAPNDRFGSNSEVAGSCRDVRSTRVSDII